MKDSVYHGLKPDPVVIVYYVLTTNRLSINLSKTNLMFFGKVKSSRNYKFSINNHVISKTVSIKFLGVFIDSRLTWEMHIEYVSAKL